MTTTPYQIVNRGVSNSELNYTHRTKPIKLNPKAKDESYRYRRDISFNAETLKTLKPVKAEKQKETGTTVIAEKKESDSAPQPPKGYRELFIATFADTHTLDSSGHYPLSDGRIFDPSAIKSQSLN